MKKLEKELYIKHAKRLSAIIDEKSTFVAYLTRPDFNNVIKTQLNVLNACERLFTKIDLDAKYSSKNLVKSFNKITKDKFAIDENYKYEDQTDLIDSINYLFTFCNNMFKVNLDDLVSGKQVTATDPKIDLRAKAPFDDEGRRINSNFTFAGAGIPLAATPYENPYLLGKAYAKLNDDMKSGKFYRYKTKPKVIPLAKWLSCILMLFLSLALIGSGTIFYILSNALDGTMFTISAIFGAYSIYITIKTIVGKTSANLNQKFYFAWGFCVTFLMLAVVFLSLGLRAALNENLSEANEFKIQCVYALKIISIIGLSLVILNIVPIVIGAIKNPKPDPEAVEKKIKEYIDIFAGDMPSNGVPPKTDVQKPTEVKKSKDTKKKK